MGQASIALLEAFIGLAGTTGAGVVSKVALLDAVQELAASHPELSSAVVVCENQLLDEVDMDAYGSLVQQWAHQRQGRVPPPQQAPDDAIKHSSPRGLVEVCPISRDSLLARVRSEAVQREAELLSRTPGLDVSALHEEADRAVVGAEVLESALRQKGSQSLREWAEQMFDLTDMTQRGMLDEHQVHQLLEAYHHGRWNLCDTKRATSHLVSHGSGLTFQGFLDMMERFDCAHDAQGRDRLATAAIRQARQQVVLQEHGVLDRFVGMDTNRDGVLDKQEFIRGMKAMMPLPQEDPQRPQLSRLTLPRSSEIIKAFSYADLEGQQRLLAPAVHSLLQALEAALGRSWGPADTLDELSLSQDGVQEGALRKDEFVQMVQARLCVGLSVTEQQVAQKALVQAAEAIRATGVWRRSERGIEPATNSLAGKVLGIFRVAVEESQTGMGLLPRGIVMKGALEHSLGQILEEGEMAGFLQVMRLHANDFVEESELLHLALSYEASLAPDAGMVDETKVDTLKAEAATRTPSLPREDVRSPTKEERMATLRRLIHEPSTPAECNTGAAASDTMVETAAASLGIDLQSMHFVPFDELSSIKHQSGAGPQQEASSKETADAHATLRNDDVYTTNAKKKADRLLQKAKDAKKLEERAKRKEDFQRAKAKKQAGAMAKKMEEEHAARAKAQQDEQRRAAAKHNAEKRRREQHVMKKAVMIEDGRHVDRELEAQAKDIEFLKAEICALQETVTSLPNPDRKQAKAYIAVLEAELSHKVEGFKTTSQSTQETLPQSDPEPWGSRHYGVPNMADLKALISHLPPSPLKSEVQVGSSNSPSRNSISRDRSVDSIAENLHSISGSRSRSQPHGANTQYSPPPDSKPRSRSRSRSNSRGRTTSTEYAEDMAFKSRFKSLRALYEHYVKQSALHGTPTFAAIEAANHR